MPCSATASGSTSAACLSERLSGTRQRLGRADRSCSAANAPCQLAVVGADPARARRTATPGRARQYSHSPHLGDCPRTDPVADRPARHVRAERGDRARELVALDHAGAAAPLDEEVQVGAADPAVADLEQQLARARARGVGRSSTATSSQAHEHGGRHRSRDTSAVMAQKSRPNLTRASTCPANAQFPDQQLAAKSAEATIFLPTVGGNVVAAAGRRACWTS